MKENIRVEDVSSIKKKVFLNIGPETVSEKLDEYFGMVRKNAIIDGFRRGKVPVPVLKGRFIDEARKIVSKSFITESYQCLLKDYDFIPIGNPEIKNENSIYGKFENDNSFSAEMTIEILPKIDPMGYNDIALNIKKRDPNEIYQAKIEELREQFAEREQIQDSGAQIGDSVVVDFKGFLDGQPFNGGEASGFSIDKLGSGNFVSGFEEQIVGMSPEEEKRISVRFPENYSFESVAGKDTEFDIKLHTIVRSKKSNLDDDLAMMAGFSNLSEMEGKLKEVAAKDSDKLFKLEAENIIIDELINKNEFELPTTLLTGEIQRLATERKNLPVDILMKQAERNCRRALLLDAIYEKEKLDLDPNELDVFLEDHAKMYNQSKDELVSLLNNTNQMDSFLGTLRANKAIEFIVRKNIKQESEA